MPNVKSTTWEWIGVRFKRITCVTGVTVQGRPDKEHYVKKYKVGYKQGTEKEFHFVQDYANNDRVSSLQGGALCNLNFGSTD